MDSRCKRAWPSALFNLYIIFTAVAVLSSFAGKGQPYAEVFSFGKSIRVNKQVKNQHRLQLQYGQKFKSESVYFFMLNGHHIGTQVKDDFVNLRLAAGVSLASNKHPNFRVLVLPHFSIGAHEGLVIRSVGGTLFIKQSISRLKIKAGITTDHCTGDNFYLPLLGFEYNHKSWDVDLFLPSKAYISFTIHPKLRLYTGLIYESLRYPYKIANAKQTHIGIHHILSGFIEWRCTNNWVISTTFVGYKANQEKVEKLHKHPFLPKPANYIEIKTAYRIYYYD